MLRRITSGLFAPAIKITTQYARPFHASEKVKSMVETHDEMSARLASEKWKLLQENKELKLKLLKAGSVLSRLSITNSMSDKSVTDVLAAHKTQRLEEHNFAIAQCEDKLLELRAKIRNQLLRPKQDGIALTALVNEKEQVTQVLEQLKMVDTNSPEFLDRDHAQNIPQLNGFRRM